MPDEVVDFRYRVGVRSWALAPPVGRDRVPLLQGLGVPAVWEDHAGGPLSGAAVGRPLSERPVVATVLLVHAEELQALRDGSHLLLIAGGAVVDGHL